MLKLSSYANINHSALRKQFAVQYIIHYLLFSFFFFLSPKKSLPPSLSLSQSKENLLRALIWQWKKRWLWIIQDYWLKKCQVISARFINRKLIYIFYAKTCMHGIYMFLFLQFEKQMFENPWNSAWESPRFGIKVCVHVDPPRIGS